MDLPAILQPQNRQELLNKAREAGANHLTPAKTALWLGLSEKEAQLLMYQDTEVAYEFHMAHLKEEMHQLEITKEIANNSDPENKQRLAAAWKLYELYSGHKQNNTTFNIAIQNNHPQAIRTESAIKIVDAVDLKTIEDIQND
jgi:hypothetical protein